MLNELNFVRHLGGGRRACLAVMIAAAVTIPAGSAWADGTYPTIADTADGWETQMQSGEVKLAVDSDNFASGPRSLRIDTGPDGAEGQALFRVEVTPGEKIGIRGKLNSEGDIDYAAVAFLSAASKTPWQEIARADGLMSWESFAGEATAPEDTEIFFVVVSINGTGTVWFDDLEIISPDDIEGPKLLTEFNKKPNVTFGDFEDKADVEDGVLHLNTNGGQGGAIYFINGDYSGFAGKVPVLHAKVGDANAADKIRLQLVDSDKKILAFSYDLGGVSSDEFQMLEPTGTETLGDGDFNPAKLSTVQLQGNWKPETTDLYLDQISFAGRGEARAKSTPEDATARAARNQKAAAARDAKVKEAMANITRGEGSPEVVSIMAATPNTLAVTIDAREVKLFDQEPYEAMPGDEIRTAGADILVWKDGEVVTASRERRFFTGRTSRAVSSPTASTARRMATGRRSSSDSKPQAIR